MTFRVQPGYLDGYALQVGRAGSDAIAVRSYLEKHPAPAGHGEGALICLLGPGHARALESALGAIDRASGVLLSSKSGLNSAASYYRWTDTTAAARMDRSLPAPRSAAHGTPLEQACADDPCGPSFNDRFDPSDRLTGSMDVEYSHPLGFMDNLSVSHWALVGFDAVFGFNPLERITSEVVGDWQAVAQSGVAFGHAAQAVHDIGYNLQGGAIALRGGWEGAAAEQAYAHFSRTASSLAELQDPFAEMSAELGEIAHGVWSSCEALSGIVKMLLDKAIIAGISAAAGTATATSGIGPVIGYGVAALQVVDMLRLWGQATKMISNLYTAVQGALGVIESQIARIDAVSLPNAASYHHPFVPQHPQARPDVPINAGGR